MHLFFRNIIRTFCFLTFTDNFLFSEGTLQDFFFLDIAPIYPNYFEHEEVETLEECSDVCVRDIRLCVAFTFYPTNHTCRKYKQSITLDGVPPTKVVETRDSNRDGMYFEKLGKLPLKSGT